MTKKDIPNYCHDPDIIHAAIKLGVRDHHVINKALSIGEAGAYRSTDRSEGFLAWIQSLMKENKTKQPKQRLSKRQKQEILARHSQQEQSGGSS